MAQVPGIETSPVPIVDMTLHGTIHKEGNRLVVGRTDVLDAIEEQWGGGAMDCVFMVSVFPVVSTVRTVNPGGRNYEKSEPAER